MIPFKPVVEPSYKDAFMTKEPKEVFKSGDFNQVPWIVGLNTEDGALRVAGLDIFLKKWNIKYHFRYL